MSSDKERVATLTTCLADALYHAPRSPCQDRYSNNVPAAGCSG